MNTKELREKSSEQLKTDLMGLLREQFNLRLMKSQGGLKKNHLVQNCRRQIARIKTILNEKQG